MCDCLVGQFARGKDKQVRLGGCDPGKKSLDRFVGPTDEGRLRIEEVAEAFDLFLHRPGPFLGSDDHGAQLHAQVPETENLEQPVPTMAVGDIKKRESQDREADQEQSGNGCVAGEGDEEGKPACHPQALAPGKADRRAPLGAAGIDPLRVRTRCRFHGHSHEHNGHDLQVSSRCGEPRTTEEVVGQVKKSEEQQRQNDLRCAEAEINTFFPLGNHAVVL